MTRRAMFLLFVITVSFCAGFWVAIGLVAMGIPI